MRNDYRKCILEEISKFVITNITQLTRFSKSEIEVVSYETVTNEDGSQIDVAVVNTQGQAVMIADVDQNGVADIMASDLNYNGQLDNGEIVDVSDQNIAMQPLQDAANMNGNNMVAQTGEPDYINDANVDDYIA